MARNKNQNKTSGRIVFILILAAATVIGVMAMGENAPKTTHITKIIEHNALN